MGLEAEKEQDQICMIKRVLVPEGEEAKMNLGRPTEKSYSNPDERRQESEPGWWLWGEQSRQN